MREMSRRDGYGIAWLADERRLSGKDGVGIESVGRRRWYAQLSEQSPELSVAPLTRYNSDRFIVRQPVSARKIETAEPGQYEWII